MYNFRCMDKEQGGMMYDGNMSMPGMECPVIYECPIERVCHRVINHHIYKHTYTPE